jgi:hypothetical protein
MNDDLHKAIAKRNEFMCPILNGCLKRLVAQDIEFRQFCTDMDKGDPDAIVSDALHVLRPAHTEAWEKRKAGNGRP